MTIRYLTAAEVYSINEEVVEERPFVRDRHLLRSALIRPRTKVFGEEAYPSLFDKAAALLHSLAYHHLFGDGNKRTATRATVRFLEANGYHPTWTADEIYNFVLDVAKGGMEVETIATWLIQHTQSDS